MSAHVLAHAGHAGHGGSVVPGAVALLVLAALVLLVATAGRGAR